MNLGAASNNLVAPSSPSSLVPPAPSPALENTRGPRAPRSLFYWSVGTKRRVGSSGADGDLPDPHQVVGVTGEQRLRREPREGIVGRAAQPMRSRRWEEQGVTGLGATRNRQQPQTRGRTEQRREVQEGPGKFWGRLRWDPGSSWEGRGGEVLEVGPKKVVGKVEVGPKEALEKVEVKPKMFLGILRSAVLELGPKKLWERLTKEPRKLWGRLRWDPKVSRKVKAKPQKLLEGSRGEVLEVAPKEVIGKVEEGHQHVLRTVVMRPEKLWGRLWWDPRSSRGGSSRARVSPVSPSRGGVWGWWLLPARPPTRPGRCTGAARPCCWC